MKKKLKDLCEASTAPSIGRLFIDPGTNSTGWAFVDQDSYCILEHGTLTAHPNTIWERIHEISGKYYTLAEQLITNHQKEEYRVHFERMNFRVHVGVIHSVGAIATEVMAWHFHVDEQISPTAWQKTVDWKNEGSSKLISRYKCDSMDQAAAIGMALHWIAQQKEKK